MRFLSRISPRDGPGRSTGAVPIWRLGRRGAPSRVRNGPTEAMRRTCGELVDAQLLSDADIHAATSAFLKNRAFLQNRAFPQEGARLENPGAATFRFAGGYRLDLSAAVWSSTFATHVIQDRFADVSYQRMAVRFAILLARPEAE